MTIGIMNYIVLCSCKTPDQTRAAYIESGSLTWWLLMATLILLKGFYMHIWVYIHPEASIFGIVQIMQDSATWEYL